MKWLENLLKFAPEFSMCHFEWKLSKYEGDMLPPWYMFPVSGPRYFLEGVIEFYIFPINLIVKFQRALNIRWNDFRMQEFKELAEFRNELQPHVKNLWVHGYSKGFNHGILARNEVLKRKNKTKNIERE